MDKKEEGRSELCNTKKDKLLSIGREKTHTKIQKNYKNRNTPKNKIKENPGMSSNKITKYFTSKEKFGHGEKEIGNPRTIKFTTEREGESIFNSNYIYGAKINKEASIGNPNIDDNPDKFINIEPVFKFSL